MIPSQSLLVALICGLCWRDPPRAVPCPSASRSSSSSLMLHKHAGSECGCCLSSVLISQPDTLSKRLSLAHGFLPVELCLSIGFPVSPSLDKNCKILHHFLHTIYHLTDSWLIYQFLDVAVLENVIPDGGWSSNPCSLYVTVGYS